MGDEFTVTGRPEDKVEPAENPYPTNKGGDPWVDAPQEDHETPVADQPTGTEPHDLPAYGNSTNLKTDRVFKAGEPDMNAVADTTHTARGNQYPPSQAALDNRASAARAEADRLYAAAETAAAEADRLEQEAADHASAQEAKAS